MNETSESIGNLGALIEEDEIIEKEVSERIQEKTRLYNTQ